MRGLVRRSALLAALVAGLLVPATASAAPPGNDLFAGATTLRAATGSYSGTNREATKEAGEPKHAGNAGGSSVWFKWTAPASGTATFDTFGSGLDSLLAVYTGTSVGALTLVAQNDDATSAKWTSKLSFGAKAGTTYSIAVDGYNSGSGPYLGTFAVNWQLTGTGVTAPNDGFASAVATDGASGTTHGSSFGATKQSGEPNHAGNAGGASVWLRWTAPADGVYGFSTEGSLFDTVLAVYSGASLGGLTPVAANDDTAWNNLRSTLTITTQQGVTYSIAIDGKRFAYSGAASGDYTLKWWAVTTSPGTAAPAPVNDSFADALRLTGVGGISRRTTAGATKQPAEPAHAGNRGGASVWYRWQAPTDGQWRFYTPGSAFNTLLGVYTGSGVDALTEVGSSDDVSSTDQTSSVAIVARAGTEYWIAVDGFRSATGFAASGNFNLYWELVGPDPALPSNDDFASARALSGTGGHATATNRTATKQAGEPAHAGSAGGASVWFKWTADATGSVLFDTPGSSFDTLLGVYTGSSIGALQEVAANDDIAYNHWWPSGRYRESYVSWPAEQGQTYYIAVDGKAGARGSVYLGWSLTPPAGDETLLAAGDIGRCDSTFDDATGAMFDQFPTSPVAALGDIAYENGTAAEVQCFDRAWGKAKSRIRPVPGDHDYGTPGAAPYFAYFGASAGATGKGYYSYELGRWHIVALNANCAEVGGCGVGSPQEQWLRNDLRAQRSRCILAYASDPLFASVGGQEAALAPLWQALAAYGADVVLGGDRHYYERFGPQTPSGTASSTGIREFIVGTGGAPLLATPSTRAANSELIGVSYGLLRLVLHPDSYDWQFLPAAGGTFTDAGHGDCSA